MCLDLPGLKDLEGLRSGKCKDCDSFRHDGTAVARYTGLVSYDTTGRDLGARMELRMATTQGRPYEFL